jgi:hypothetical protein
MRLETAEPDFAPLADQLALWIDEVAGGVGGLAFVTNRLLERHRRYFARRVPSLVASPASSTWLGVCPFCAASFEIDGVSGWWSCRQCYRRGEALSLEFQLFGKADPGRWEQCRRHAEAIMGSPCDGSVPA